MTATRWRSVALSFIGLLTAGCGLSVLGLRDILDFNQAYSTTHWQPNKGAEKHSWPRA